MIDTTWATLWRQTAEEVGDQTEARWLCETAAGLSGTEFAAALGEVPTERMVAHFDAMLAARRAGEPLQYVLGHWAFRRLDLAVDRRVLIPRPETETVVEVALGLLREVDGARRVADLGTGSGAIGLALADELPLDGTEVWLTDASGDALDVARANLTGIGRAAANVRIAHGPWLDALADAGLFDVIVSNPPYVAVGSPELESQVAQWEPASALFGGADGLDHIREIVVAAPAHLRGAGSLVLEIGADQGAATSELLIAAGFVKVGIRPDPAGRDRVAVGRVPS